jgi:hypothetical protein
MFADASARELEKNAIIRPPSTAVLDPNDRAVHQIFVDSRYRDKSLFPRPDCYEISLHDDVSDVISASLMYASVPFTAYLISEHNRNIIVLDPSGAEHRVQLDVGDFSDDDLLSHIQARMDASSLGAGFATVAYNKTRDNYTFASSAGAFALRFASGRGTAHELLGFDEGDYPSNSDAPPFSVTSPFRRNREHHLDYIMLAIDEFRLLKSGADARVEKCFALIPRNATGRDGESSFNTGSERISYTKYFSPTIPRLTKLRVNFYDKYGNPYDFQNVDHHFEIQLTCYKQQRKYQSIFT